MPPREAVEDPELLELEPELEEVEEGAEEPYEAEVGA